MPTSPQWQCVLMCWGTKYGAPEIDHLAAQISAHAAVPPKMVLMTDKKRDDLTHAFDQRIIPPYYLADAFTKAGCQAKLALFLDGVLPAGLPTVFVDLDTVVLGDLARVLDCLDTPDRIAMLGNNPNSFGAVARLLDRMTNGRVRSRGNSSVLAFVSGAHSDIDTEFRALWAQNGGAPRFMQADDRFISYVRHQNLRAVPSKIAVKFPREFMFRQKWLGPLIAALPWVRARRANLVAVTFPGTSADPTRLAQMADGDRLVDDKGRWLIWSTPYLGTIKNRLRAALPKAKP